MLAHYITMSLKRRTERDESLSKHEKTAIAALRSQNAALKAINAQLRQDNQCITLLNLKINELAHKNQQIQKQNQLLRTELSVLKKKYDIEDFVVVDDYFSNCRTPTLLGKGNAHT